MVEVIRADIAEQAAKMGLYPGGGPTTTPSGRRVGTVRCVRSASIALADDSIIGLWGGTTDSERREMRRGSVVA